MEKYEKFAQTLNHLMQIKGTTRMDLVNDLNVPYTTVRNWQTGTRKPKYGSLLELAEYFGVSIQELLGNEVENETNDYVIQLNGQKFVFEPKRLGRQEQEMLIDYYNFLLAKTEKQND